MTSPERVKINSLEKNIERLERDVRVVLLNSNENKSEVKRLNDVIIDIKDTLKQIKNLINKLEFEVTKTSSQLDVYEKDKLMEQIALYKKIAIIVTFVLLMAFLTSLGFDVDKFKL